MHASYSSLLSLGLLALSSVSRANPSDDGLVDAKVYYAHNTSSLKIRSSFLSLFSRQAADCTVSTDFTCPSGDGCCHVDETCCGSEYCCGTGYECCDNTGLGSCVPTDGDCCTDGSSCEAGFSCILQSGVMKCKPSSGSGDDDDSATTTTKPQPTGFSGSDNDGDQSVFTFTVTWDYLSYSWKESATTFAGSVLPALTSIKETTKSVVTITADDSLDATLSLGVVSAELEASIPVAATTALGSTPAALQGFYTNANGDFATPTFGPGVPGAAGRVALSGGGGGVWGMVLVGVAFGAGVGMVML